MTRASEEAKREECSVRVIDVERGSDVDAEVLSGGEGVLVSEALSLALTMITCRQWGIDGPTIIRDEPNASLSPAAARAYIALIRRAADLVGASKALVITHSQELASLCDSRLHVHDGVVEVAA
jgi:DNA repair exonuclease SbcCD ATPase subunit